MPGISLEKLLGPKSEIGRIVASMSGTWDSPFSIEDAHGMVIFGENPTRQGQRFPIVLDDQTLGWVTGEGQAAVLAAILNYCARQEAEKKSLANELVERYRELSLLYHLSEHIAATPQPEAVAEIALEEVRRLIKADSGAILFLEDGTFRTASVFGVFHPEPFEGSLLERIVQSGKAELVNDYAIDVSITVGDERQVSVLGAPLKTEQKTIGIIVLTGSSNQVFTSGELKLLNTIAMQVAPALEISRLYQESIEKARFEQELKMARQVQESLLPAQLPKIHGWSAASRWRPAREVSGDFYDIIAEDDQPVDLVIADVTDKGMPAALFMAFTRSILRISMQGGGAPADIIASVNRSICRDSNESLFTTLVYARLSPASGELKYVNAGHNPPLLYHARTGAVEILRRTGLPLGVDIETAYSQGAAQMEEDDFLLFYTDGITEATNPQMEEYGIERLKQQVLFHRECDAETILKAVEAALLEYTGQSQPDDDMTMMGLKRTKPLEG